MQSVLSGLSAEARQRSTGLQLVGDGDALVEHLNGAIVLPPRDHLAGLDRATGVDTEDASFILRDKRHSRIGADRSIAGIRDCSKCLPSQRHRFPRLRSRESIIEKIKGLLIASPVE